MERSESKDDSLDNSNKKSGWLSKTMQDENFSRFAKFGFLDGSILLLSLFVGVSFDGMITRFVGVSGYGPLVGAAVGNTIADCVASLPEGKSAVLGITLGSCLSAAPLALAMTFRAKLSNQAVKRVLSGSYFTLIFGALFHRQIQDFYYAHKEKKKLME